MMASRRRWLWTPASYSDDRREIRKSLFAKLPLRPMFSCPLLIFAHRNLVRDLHSVDHHAANIVCGRISGSSANNPVAHLGGTTNFRFADDQRAHAPKRVRCRPVVCTYHV